MELVRVIVGGHLYVALSTLKTPSVALHSARARTHLVLRVLHFFVLG